MTDVGSLALSSPAETCAGVWGLILRVWVPAHSPNSGDAAPEARPAGGALRIIYNFLQSARLLADCICSFEANCVTGIKANKEKMHHNLYNSLMLVTALNPYIGYENAAKTAKKAYKENISLKEACVALGFLTAEKFDEVFRPEEMAYPQK